MGKYDDLKRVSDESLFTKEKIRKEGEAKFKEMWKVALRLSLDPLLSELREIGRTFLEHRFIFRTGYKIEHSWSTDGSSTYYWSLRYREKYHYVTSVSVSMSFKYQYGFSFQVHESRLLGPPIEPATAEQVIVRLKTFLGELESKISGELDQIT